MIGHLINILTPAEEGWVLTRVMGPRTGAAGSRGSNCLLQVIAGEWNYCYWRNITSWIKRPTKRECSVGYRYDDLCARFGTMRINNLIRDRIVANQIRRAVAGQREAVTV